MSTPNSPETSASHDVMVSAEWYAGFVHANPDNGVARVEEIIECSSAPDSAFSCLLADVEE